MTTAPLRSSSGRPALSAAKAPALLAYETRVQRGPVARELDGVTIPEGHHLLKGDRFLLRAPGGIGLAYRRGEGVTLEHPRDADPRDIDLWLNGTLYAAIAAINGLMPLHASAVAHGGKVYAFSGPPGAGKSTLAAALGRAGLPLFCDDTLILDYSGSGPIACLPGHKRLKLWPEGVELSGATPREHVASDYLKHFAESSAGVVAEPLPLAELFFLERGDEPALLPVIAGERIARLQDDHYTARLFEEAGGLERRDRFGLLAALAARMPMQRFVRPFTRPEFQKGIFCMVQHITSGASR